MNALKKLNTFWDLTMTVFVNHFFFGGGGVSSKVLVVHPLGAALACLFSVFMYIDVFCEHGT